MNPSLQLNISQQLTLTPQLQQAIRLLQLSTPDLRQEIQQLVESNPMLDAVAIDETPPQKSIEPKDEFADFQWSQLYSESSKGGGNVSHNENGMNYDNIHCTTTNLADHLRWQLDLTPMSDIDKVIATLIIDALNDDGLLTSSVPELHANLNSSNYPLDLDEIEMVRHRLQHFDPIGCASLNLSEVLLMQLKLLPDSADIQIAKKIIRNDIQLLGKHNYQQLMKNYQLNDAGLKKVLQIIHRLNPKPGSLIYQNKIDYITPDIVVKKIANSWQVLLNKHTLPRLTINKQYASLIQRADNSIDNQFLKNNLQEARWFLKSIQNRQETLLKVAKCIIEYQTDFLTSGERAMKPLILNDVANILNMHESTISRITTQKYIHTHRGVFELKYFFSSHVTTTSGEECSSTAIRAIIKTIVSTENRKKPLSDNKIAQLIAAQGIQVARRTVAKYREALGVLPSNERKTMNK